MKRLTKNKDSTVPRRELRLPHLLELRMNYEGDSENIPLRPPNISPHGMFVNTSTHFPEGAIVNLRFRLTRSNVEVQTRGEVRYCLPGIGIGVEFVGMQPEAVRAIEKEIRASSRARARKKAAHHAVADARAARRRALSRMGFARRRPAGPVDHAAAAAPRPCGRTIG